MVSSPHIGHIPKDFLPDNCLMKLTCDTIMKSSIKVLKNQSELETLTAHRQIKHSDFPLFKFLVLHATTTYFSQRLMSGVTMIDGGF